MCEINIQYNFMYRSLPHLLGETWKDIPGFEGSYQASNYGRVKSLDRVVPHPRLKQQFVKGRILTQSVYKNKNIKTGQPMIDLWAALSIEGIPHYFNTRRIIYQTFIDPTLNYEKDGFYVINKDYNGYDNKLVNLRLCTKSENQKRAINRDR
ncbi:NUMOD4 domain-containing protein [Mucilaginibacter sp. SJ]|uniref:NUMOD4 domain-containing protein n=1 Tax=Mucilaginibacter sp. SJ TaxID=3029053 RepID=UPI0023A91971|nr:NUMOD4 domain-containing protein [Mucilaginibacter sp. SJ]WEA00668.1 NUMOD4 domain-containing protein [Mucilaginibacter sp. SJ]